MTDPQREQLAAIWKKEREFSRAFAGLPAQWTLYTCCCGFQTTDADVISSHEPHCAAIMAKAKQQQLQRVKKLL